MGLMRDDVWLANFTTKPRLHKIIHVIWTCNNVRTWGFLSSFLLWDIAHAKIYKFDFRIRGLVVKLASQTSSRIRAIGFLSTFSSDLIESGTKEIISGAHRGNNLHVLDRKPCMSPRPPFPGIWRYIDLIHKWRSHLCSGGKLICICPLGIP